MIPRPPTPSPARRVGEKQPNSALTGKSIVVTRALHQADELNALLHERGAVPLAYPCIAFVPPEDTTPLDEALQDAAAGGYDWLILTSSNAALMLGERLGRQLTANAQRSPRIPKIAVVGEATAKTARECLGIDAELIPHEYHAEAIADILGTQVAGARVLLPQSEIADLRLYERLTAAGAVVTAITAYRTVMGTGGEDVPAMLQHKQVDAITFTSPSTIENFLQRLTNEGGRRDELNGVCIACLGKTTARAAETQGLCVNVIPDTQTIKGLVEGLEGYFEKKGVMRFKKIIGT